MIEANNPNLKSWIDVKADSDFPIQNLPFGIYRHGGDSPKAATIIGNQVINLDALHELGFFSNMNLPSGIFRHTTLNGFIALGKQVTNVVRDRLSEIFTENNSELRDNPEAKAAILIDYNEVEMLMPIRVGDYTDFYSSEQHATNVGTMFRDPDNALLPNWKHMPVGYHGRSSSIVVSGTDITRPKGQTMDPEATKPSFGPTRRLDFELEMAFITGQANELGDSVSTEEADDYIFGFTLFNDWSARDIQKWEYVPLGPFLAKNFASSMSPWIVTLEALEPFRVAGPVQNPEVLPYLKYSGDSHFDINLEVFIQPEGSVETCVSRTNFKHMYWNVRQQLAHQTVNGCNVNVGDMYASGTISGPTPDSYGSMLELAWKGTKPLLMPDGTKRKFIHDGDQVSIRGFAEKNGIRIGFGVVTNKIKAAK